MTINEAINNVSQKLAQCALDEPLIEARFIVAGALGIDNTQLLISDKVPSEDEINLIHSYAKRRAAREPLSYILGHVDFLGLKISVTPDVLIPRPETELFVEEIIKRLSPRRGLCLLDLCTGSGCIALALARHLDCAGAMACDISPEALKVAVRNGQENCPGHIEFLKGDLFEPAGGQKFDLIVSNPPYVKSSDIRTLEPEVRLWEPAAALDGGVEGLDIIMRILEQAPMYLKPGGLLALEIDQGQGERIIQKARKLENAGYSEPEVKKDLAGLERYFYCYFSP